MSIILPAHLIRDAEAPEPAFAFSNHKLNVIFQYIGQHQIIGKAFELVNNNNFGELTTVRIPVHLSDLKNRTADYSELSEPMKVLFERHYASLIVILIFDKRLNKVSNLMKWQFGGFEAV